MPTHTYFDSPGLYRHPKHFYDVGASPYLLEELIKHIDEAASTLGTIYVAFYLFNNKILSEKLIQLAASGVKVHIITIPISGYDKENPQEIRLVTTQAKLGPATKYTLAREVFAPYYRNKVAGATLSFFPHQYIRSSSFTGFSKSEMPYSMHIKGILAIKKDGGGFVALSSSNFAVRDAIKEEYLVVIEDEPEVLAPVKQFFEHLRIASIPIADFDFKSLYNKYPTPATQYPVNTRVGFTAPFYPKSNLNAEKDIVNLIANATSTIQIAAQHICFTVGWRNGILEALKERAAAGVSVQIISQTFASGNREIDKHCRTPANTEAFIEFYNAIARKPNISYHVNENLHSKYIIADRRVLVSSFNYTPTQLIYKKVSINTDKLQYEGIFSECGIYTIIDDDASVAAFKANFEELKKREHTLTIQ
ncbi:phospholipase D-like domain-containing protein [Mucilaginibacter pedocola]|uniref:phospholipase D n=1 Tax=Mucilaginibacter pedocola TaxID=1792845 RepID=A0A1S9PDI5_9SPHI|nr:phospholipase D-like domain-containing protein [Mucilaginibacter pedocola]OOQ58947.1 hypothetical protein BC343_30225 [Mucilaginibacter pedocola]